MNFKKHTIGWKWIGPIPDVMIDSPEKFTFDKPTNPAYRKTGYTNCPPTKKYFQNVYTLKSPSNFYAEVINNKVVFPEDKNDIRNLEYSNVIQIHNELDLEHMDVPVIQINLNYLFVSDLPCRLEIIPPFESVNYWPGHVTAGEMDIQKWIRPVSWGFVWKDTSKPLKIKKGDPLCYVRFVTDETVNLIEMEMTDQLYARIDNTTKVTKFTKRSAMSYIKTSFSRRPKKLIVPKD